MTEALTDTFRALCARTQCIAATRDERGEGVISAAIAVMIMAFLGAAMWLAFKGIFDDAATSTSKQVSEIGK